MATPETGPVPIRPTALLNSCLTVLGLLMLAAVVARSTFSPIIYYDSWWYHLPFSSYIWNIGGGSDTFQISSFLMERFKGFPLLWETVQGAFWVATGALWAITVPQTLLVLFYLYICRSLLSIPIAWIVLGLVACPMLLLHLQSTNNDLPAAIMIAVAFLLMSHLLSAAPGPMDWVKAAGVVLAFAIAGNIKYQALLACFAITAILGCGCLFLRGSSLPRRVALVTLLAVAMAMANISAIKNVIQYGNPFYPIHVTVAGSTLFKGPESAEHDANYPSYLLRGAQPVSFPSPVNFVLSITELDWTMRGVAPWYNLDSVTGGSPRRGPPSRTGGWGIMFVMLNLMLILMQLLCIRDLSDRRHRILLLNVTLLTVLTAFLPRSHELRYWLYLPLLWVPLNVRYLVGSFRQSRFTIAYVAGMAGLGVTLAALSPKSGMLELFIPTRAHLLAEVAPDAREAIATTGRYCNGNSHYGFHASTAVTGRPAFVAVGSDLCAPAK